MKYDNLTLIFILLLMIVRCGCVQYLVSTGWNPRDHWDLLLRGWLSWDSDMITWSPFPPLTSTRSCKDNLHLSIIHTARLGYLDDGNTRGLKNLANDDFLFAIQQFYEKLTDRVAPGEDENALSRSKYEPIILLAGAITQMFPTLGEA